MTENMNPCNLRFIFSEIVLPRADRPFINTYISHLATCVGEVKRKRTDILLTLIGYVAKKFQILSQDSS